MNQVGLDVSNEPAIDQRRVPLAAHTAAGVPGVVFQKRASDQAQINDLIEKGKEGINKAAKKFNLKDGADKFRIFAVNYVEDAMDGKGGGFFSKLFG